MIEGADHARNGATGKKRPFLTVEGWLAFGSTVALLGVVLAYASLLPLGKWHPDEFTRLHFMQADGWRQIPEMIFGWSPRPVSELVLWVYAAIVARTGQPYSAYFLAALWTTLLLGLYFAARRDQRYPALTAIVLVAAFLLLEKPGEMFYWPVGAAAYLLLTGSLGIACLLAAERQPRPWLLGATLVSAAWCSEIGALAVIFYAASLLIARIVFRRRVQICWLMWGVILAAALFPILISVLHRGAMNEVMRPGSPTVGSLWNSLTAAVPDQVHELLTARLGSGWWAILPAVAVKLLLFLGFRALATDRRASMDASIPSILLGLSLMLASYGSLALSYDKFGMNCCERQTTFRAALVVLALYSLAQAWPLRRTPVWRPIVLALPLIAVFCWRAPDLIYDHGLIAVTRSNRSDLWRSGRQPGPAMVWRNAPIPRIADGDWRLEPGTYTRTSDTAPGSLDWRYFAVLVFFGKHILTVLPR
jgi:hypothetical protein